MLAREPQSSDRSCAPRCCWPRSRSARPRWLPRRRRGRPPPAATATHPRRSSRGSTRRSSPGARASRSPAPRRRGGVLRRDPTVRPAGGAAGLRRARRPDRRARRTAPKGHRRKDRLAACSTPAAPARPGIERGAVARSAAVRRRGPAGTAVRRRRPRPARRRREHAHDRLPHRRRVGRRARPTSTSTRRLPASRRPRTENRRYAQRCTDRVGARRPRQRRHPRRRPRPRRPARRARRPAS